MRAEWRARRHAGMFPIMKAWFGGLLAGSALVAAALAGRLAVRADALGDADGPAPRPPFTIEDRLGEFGEAAVARMQPHFDRAGVAYPPREIMLVGLKSERELLLYARGSNGDWRWVRTYPVLAVSGGPGPKLREGDLQAPEGLYGIEFLNANSRYHVSLRVNYPNAFDRARAAEEGRTGLGGDIMIHGRAASVGCLAMGDPAAEELFTLAAATGLDNVRVILAPVDLRVAAAPAVEHAPDWLPALYAELAAELQNLPAAGR
jgi:hypothetical protein